MVTLSPSSPASRKWTWTPLSHSQRQTHDSANRAPHSTELFISGSLIGGLLQLPPAQMLLWGLQGLITGLIQRKSQKSPLQRSPGRRSPSAGPSASVCHAIHLSSDSLLQILLQSRIKNRHVVFWFALIPDRTTPLSPNYPQGNSQGLYLFGCGLKGRQRRAPPCLLWQPSSSGLHG